MVIFHGKVLNNQRICRLLLAACWQPRCQGATRWPQVTCDSHKMYIWMAKSHWCLWGKPWPPPAPKQAPLDFAIASVLDSWSWSRSIRLRTCCRLLQAGYWTTRLWPWHNHGMVCILYVFIIYTGTTWNWNYLCIQHAPSTPCFLMFSPPEVGHSPISSPIAGAACLLAFDLCLRDPSPRRIFP